MLSTPTFGLALFCDVARFTLCSNRTHFIHKQFVENQIEEFREHAHTHHCRCHGRTHFQWYCDFADCHPSVLVDPFDHHATPAFPIVPGTTIPVNDNFPLSFGSQIGPVIGFLIVFPEDVFHVVIRLRGGDGVGVLPFPTREQCFLDLANSSSVLLSQRILSIHPLTCHNPRVPRPSVSSRYLSFLSLSFHCTVDNFTLSSANVATFVLSANAHFCSFTHPVFLSGPVRGNFVPDVSTIVPLPLVFPSRVVAQFVSHPSCLRGLPPPCTSTSENAFQGVDHRTGSFVTNTSFRQSLHTEKAMSSVSISSWPFCRLLHGSRPMFLFSVL